MKFDVRAFKNMEIALSEIWPRISAAELKNGRPVEKFGNLLPREIWANWLLCAALTGSGHSQPLPFPNAIGLPSCWL